jgi:pimeloyl-ACP methyl ester carboxylesterase
MGKGRSWMLAVGLSAGAAALGAASSAQAAGPSAVTAPIRTVRVAWGKIGYRALGRGRPLVLVTGYSDSVDEWAPRFIDALAPHHRVFALDNEGVGHTTLRAGTLTISRMGDDTAAFIAALHLQRPDVLGWSMGGETVQALAVRHPGSVRRLILCSTAPGDGSALPPHLRSGGPPYSNFFPPDQNAARLAFIADIHRYSGFYMAPTSVDQLQATAGQDWGEGREPAGHRLYTVRAPALIAEGAVVWIDPNNGASAAPLEQAEQHRRRRATVACSRQSRSRVGSPSRPACRAKSATAPVARSSVQRALTSWKLRRTLELRPETTFHFGHWSGRQQRMLPLTIVANVKATFERPATAGPSRSSSQTSNGMRPPHL